MTGSVQVWLLSTRHSPATVERLSGLLDQAERSRRDGLVDDAVRAEFVLCRAALRLLVADRLAVQPQSLRFETGRHGKPGLAGGALQFNLSHSDGLAAIALSDRAVGVDLQQRRTGSGLDRMATRYFPAREAAWVCAATDPVEVGRRFSELWSRKEACLKATGGRLIPSLAWPVSSRPGGWFGWAEPALIGRDLEVPAGWHGAVAVAGSEPFDLDVRWISPNEPRARRPSDTEPLARRPADTEPRARRPSDTEPLARRPAKPTATPTAPLTAPDGDQMAGVQC